MKKAKSVKALKQLNMLKKLLIPLIIAAVFITVSVFAQSQKLAEPENPLKEVDRELLINLGKTGNADSGLGFGEDDGDETADKPEDEKPQDEKENKEKEPPKDESPTDGVEVNPSLPSDENKGGKGDGKPNSNNDKGGKGSTLKPTPNPGGNSGGNGSKGEKPVNPDDGEEPSRGEELFTTTIVDQSVLTQRDYSFEIIYLKEDYTLRERNVYVNGVKQVQFSGRVLLAEGKNDISVAASFSDIDGKLVSGYKSYTVYVDLGDITLSTNLINGNVDVDELYFEAGAMFAGEAIGLEVTLNGIILSPIGQNGINGLYYGELLSGENTVLLSAKAGERQETREYLINCTLSSNLRIRTTLSDITVNEEDFSFSAKTVNGSGRDHLTAVLNGKTVVGENGVYSVKLRLGSNVIRLKATDTVGGQKTTVDRSFTVTYVPIADEKTAPYLKSINVTEGMEILGKDHILHLEPLDYQGNRIYYENITVRLNGVTYRHSWTSEFTSYRLYLTEGKNTLEIRITDNEGRYQDYTLTLNSKVFADGEKLGEVTLSIDANVLGLGYIIEPVKVNLVAGESFEKTFTDYLKSQGFDYASPNKDQDDNDNTVSEFYLAKLMKAGIGAGVNIPQDLIDAINADGNFEWNRQRDDNALGEKDYCSGSGWMYFVNGYLPTHSLTDIVLKDGDVFTFRFTLAYGKDIGGYIGNPDENYGKIW